MLKQKIRCVQNFSQKKAVVQNYLTQHNIPFSATDTNNVLYEKIKQKKTPVVYKTDKIANLHGHEVLRTPVRHCERNPIKLIDNRFYDTSIYTVFFAVFFFNFDHMFFCGQMNYLTYIDYNT
jgi:hypothetical protein